MFQEDTFSKVDEAQLGDVQESLENLSRGTATNWS